MSFSFLHCYHKIMFSGTGDMSSSSWPSKRHKFCGKTSWYQIAYYYHNKRSPLICGPICIFLFWGVCRSGRWVSEKRKYMKVAIDASHLQSVLCTVELILAHGFQRGWNLYVTILHFISFFLHIDPFSYFQWLLHL